MLGNRRLGRLGPAAVSHGYTKGVMMKKRPAFRLIGWTFIFMVAVSRVWACGSGSSESTVASFLTLFSASRDPSAGPQSSGQCRFNPTKDERGVGCQAKFTICQAGHQVCDGYLWLYCQNKLVYKGIYSHGRASYSAFKLSGLPVGQYSSPPNIVWYVTSQTTGRSIRAVLNYDSANRDGVCSVGQGPIPY